MPDKELHDQSNPFTTIQSIGIVPIRDWQISRAKDLSRVIGSYTMAGIFTTPIETWCRELTTLIRILKKKPAKDQP